LQNEHQPLSQFNFFMATSFQGFKLGLKSVFMSPVETLPGYKGPVSDWVLKCMWMLGLAWTGCWIMLDHCRFFEAFIKERSMYYVCSNIVKPLTKPFQLSFVELVGPTAMEWFVSHYWGMAVRHFNDAIGSPDLQK